jgi:hypothetical protein
VVTGKASRTHNAVLQFTVLSFKAYVTVITQEFVRCQKPVMLDRLQ